MQMWELVPQPVGLFLMLEPQVSKAAATREGWVGGERGREPLTWSHAAKQEPGDGLQAPPSDLQKAGPSSQN